MTNGSKVLNFYKTLPFNIKKDLIKQNNNINFYHPHVKKLVLKHRNVIDIGCGPGHFINSINLQLNRFPFSIKGFRKINCKGIDFNPTAIIYGLKYSNKFKLSTEFILKSVFDISENDFNFKNNSIFIVANGSLHHTDNCLSAIEIVLKKACVFNRNISFLIGLYHYHGRKPFLEHFKNLKKQKKSEEYLKKEFHSLRGLSGDELNDESWYQDQVNHPLESQHTISEIYPLFKKYNFKLINSSLDKFSGSNIEKLIDNEEQQYHLGLQALKQKTYFPGYFTCLFSKDKWNKYM